MIRGGWGIVAWSTARAYQAGHQSDVHMISDLYTLAIFCVQTCYFRLNFFKLRGFFGPGVA